MKKIILLAVAGLVSFGASAEVKVTLKGFANDSVMVRTLNLERSKALVPDTVLVAKKGKLTLPEVAENAYYMVAPKGMDRKTGSPAYLFVAPGEKFEVAFTQTKESTECKVKGSEIQSLYDEMADKQKSLAKKINAMEKGAERDSLIEEYYNVPKQYVEANLNSPITLLALAMTDSEFAEKMLPKVGDNARNSMFGFYENKIKENIAREKEIEAAKAKTAEGEMAPDFELPTPDGSTLKMSSLRGKWVLVDFWGSWCIWCIRGIPQLKENYEKYKDKMEVLSIACRDKKDKWLAAIEKHQLNWKHVISLDNVPGTDKRVEAMFGVEGYPTKLLVDPEGRIVKRCVGEDPKFYDDFGELMK